MKKLLFFFILFNINTHIYAQRNNQITEPPTTTYPIYQIGTGLSLNYFDHNIGVMIDSLHFFNAPHRPFDKALLKIGMGLDYGFTHDNNPGFILSTGIGYIYIQDQSNINSLLDQFGGGFTVDYQYINFNAHSVGLTLYLTMDEYIVGFGGGAVLAQGSAFPYIKASFALIF
ncbi:MAG: hypothetical protein ACRC0X_04835 [Brevinema sp.]